MTKLLNLDELAPEATKTLVLKGEQHFAAETTVQDYINRVKRARNIDKDAGPEIQIEETVRLLMDIFPSVGEAAWRAMKLRELNAVIEFALAPPEDIAKAAETAAAQSEQPGNV